MSMKSYLTGVSERKAGRLCFDEEGYLRRFWYEGDGPESGIRLGQRETYRLLRLMDKKIVDVISDYQGLIRLEVPEGSEMEIHSFVYGKTSTSSSISGVQKILESRRRKLDHRILDGFVFLNGKEMQPPEKQMPLLDWNQQIVCGEPFHVLVISSDDFDEAGKRKDYRSKDALRIARLLEPNPDRVLVFKNEYANRPNVCRSLRLMSHYGAPDATIALVTRSHGGEGHLYLEPWEGMPPDYGKDLVYSDLSDLVGGKSLIVINMCCHAEPTEEEMPDRCVWMASCRRGESSYGSKFPDLLSSALGELGSVHSHRDVLKWFSEEASQLNDRLVHEIDHDHTYTQRNVATGDGEITVRVGERQHVVVKTNNFPSR